MIDKINMDIVVENAAPTIPYFGINNVLNTILNIAHANEILYIRFTLPILNNVQSTAWTGE